MRCHPGLETSSERSGACGILTSMTHIVFRLAVALSVGLFGFTLSAQVADMLVDNAVIYTADPRQPTAQAMAIRGERILAIGSSAQMKKHIGPATKKVDAGGRAVLPGLIDSHVHMRSLGDMLETFDFRTAPSVEAIGQVLAKRSAELPAGEWITGRNWDQTNWGGRFPTAAELSRFVSDRPVFLRRVDGHAAWANEKAMQIAGITKDTKDPSGGQIIRDAEGNATGVLVDKAMGLVGKHIPELTSGQVYRRLSLAAEACARLGMTSVHDAGINVAEYEAYKKLIADGRLPVRVYAMIGGTGELWQQFQKKGHEIGPLLTVRSVKLYADGALGSRGAALWQPYSDDKSNTGLLVTVKETLEDQIAEVHAAGFQVCTHAIGDRANRIVLDKYAELLKGNNDRRYRVEHSQVISLPDMQKFADHKVIASMQATHATSDMRWAAKRLGPDRVMGAYAWKRLMKLGVKVANGSDFPVEDPNPIEGFYASVTRQDKKGDPPGGWMPDQKFTREEALESWTATGAYAAFEEKDKGTLSVGKVADFLVMSRDIMTVAPLEILQAKPLLTVLGGKEVWRDKTF
jgi:predicted amidohydrolase YtcJ